MNSLFKKIIEKYLTIFSYLAVKHILFNNLDSTCVLIGLQECFHSAIKHENDGSNVVGCLQVVRNLNFNERN